jgi:GDP-4-dehydro-6-deoxy-D-mannose reductase
MEGEKVVISGINGFVGSHLAREINNTDLSVIGIGQETEVSSNVSGIVDEYYQANLVEIWPDIPNIRAVIHLAGLAAVGPSFDKPRLYINVNSSMVTNLCEYYLKQDKKPRIVIVSSGAIYSPNQSMPITEDGEIGFSSPYVVSKILNENQVTYYRNRGLDCVIVRPFNHIGPGQGKGFVLPDFYYRLSSLKKGEHAIITGNIETKRDYTDVRDIVKAYCKLALTETLEHSVYNLCTDVSVSGSEIFNELKSVMKLDGVSYEIDQSLVRPTDAKDIVGDSSRLRDELGWEPQIDLRQTVVDFVKSKSS